MNKPDGTLIMPWGKHKNEAIEDIPSSYLKWLAENCEDNDIQEAAEAEYEFRQDNRSHI